MKQNHIIHKVLIDVNVENKEKAYLIKDDINSFLTMDVFPKLEKYLNTFQDKFPGATLQLPHLTLDLAENVTSLDTALKDIIVESFKKEFTATLKPVLESDFDSQNHAQISLLSEPEKLLQTFIHFLEKGYMPWWNSNENTINILESKVFKKIISSKNFENKIASIIQKSNVRERIINQLTDTQIKQICLTIIKGKSLKINVATNTIRQLSKSTSTDRNTIWLLVLNVLQVAVNNSTTTTKLEEYTLEQIINTISFLKTPQNTTTKEQIWKEIIPIFPFIKHHENIITAGNKTLDIRNGILGTGTKNSDERNKAFDTSNRNIDTKKGTFDPSNKELDTKNGALDRSNKELATKNETLDGSNKGLDTKNETLDVNSKELDTKNEARDVNNKKLDTKKKTFDTNNKEPDTKNRTLDRSNKELDTKKTTLDESNKERDTSNRTLDPKNSTPAIGNKTLKESIEEKSKSRQSEIQNEDKKEAGIQPSTAVFEVPDNKVPNENNAYYVQNAGLVLIHPFMANLFKYCDLMDPKTQKITNPEVCIHLLHYIATGKTNQLESDMLFEKFLCNVPLQQSISRHVKLSRKHKAQANKVIEAVQQNWSAMKTASVGLLQNEFFQRPGKLVLNDNNTLTVERKAQDIFLDKLSWGIGFIKLPWQDQFIYVNW